MMIPEYWKKFVETNSLIGEDFEFSEDEDLSEMGADFEIMNEQQCISEATEAYPGIVAVKLGYFPVAMCLEGSGDYYYIKTEEGPNGALYRIYHDAVEGEKLASDGIEKVIESYASIL
ncbi:hypothetical protein [Endozoicomonas elysicola]|uniref:hypothetical protein n=1 Tax=Endozoicomonas elysicola TaxID=305900 RepID=UPI00037CB33C|nr:hypothetical protein [Endozoicomonas elysicola]